MKAQKPAEGILIRKDWGDAKSYVVPCECGCSDCEHNVWVEADEAGVTVTTYTKVKTKWWQFNRWKIMWTLLIKGYIEEEASIVMSKQQALNYSKVLESAVRNVEEFQKARMSNKNPA